MHSELVSKAVKVSIAEVEELAESHYKQVTVS